MKIITALLSILLIASVGCRATHRVQVIEDRIGKNDHHILTDREVQAIRGALPAKPDTIPNPPITTGIDYASICPYCDQVNLSHLVSIQGGAVVIAGQPINVSIGGISTNVIAPANGNLETWCITYVCRNCAMPYSDSRQQFLPQTTSVRLPIRN